MLNIQFYKYTITKYFTEYDIAVTYQHELITHNIFVMEQCTNHHAFNKLYHS